MKSIICGLLGFTLGGAIGYFVAYRQFKKKLEKEIAKVEQTQKDIYEKKLKDQEEEFNDDYDDGVVDSDKVVWDNAEEERESEYEPPKEDDNDAVDEDEEEWIDYDERARYEFYKKFEDYIGTCIPYPITQDQYEDRETLHTQIELVYYPEEDKAFCKLDNEEYESFHSDIGDEDYDTLNEANCFDYPGVWYIRNDGEGIDYQVEIGNRILENL
jgi:hypothetical protein